MRWKFKLRKPTGREVRFLCMLGVVLAIAAWKYMPRPWNPTITIATQHYEISSTAPSNSVVEVGKVIELLYSAYSNKFATIAIATKPKSP